MSSFSDHVKSLSEVNLWVGYHVHKGYLGSKTATLGRNTNREREHTSDVYYIGREDLVGVVLEGKFSIVLGSRAFSDCPWYDSLDRASPDTPWEGPPEFPNMSLIGVNTVRSKAKQVVEILNRKVTKPKIGSPRIAKEDRPDYGRTLLYHPESDCYLIEVDPEEVAKMITAEPLLEDVTGIKQHEEEYAARQTKRRFNIRKRS